MPSSITKLTAQLVDIAITGKNTKALNKDHLQCPSPEMLYRHAQRHGLVPLIYQGLHLSNLLDDVPSSIAQKFKLAYYRTLSHNLRNLQAIERLRNDLSLDIPLLILKGPALIEHVYINPAFRPMTDIDILVKPEHLHILKQCLYTQQYRSPEQYPDIYAKDNVIFDIHTDPFHANRIQQRLQAVPIQLEQLWQNAIPLRATSHNLLMLSPPDQILTLSVHALKHGYERHIWLFDILYSLKVCCQNNTWPHIEKHCQTYNTTNILSLTLHALKIHLAQSLPKPVHKLQKSFPIGPIRRKILCASPLPGHFQMLEPLVLSQQFSKRIDQVKFLIAFAFPKPEALQQISGLTGRLYWLSYPYRIVQLLSLGTIQLIKLVFRLMGKRSS
jgi:hypothetical protein